MGVNCQTNFLPGPKRFESQAFIHNFLFRVLRIGFFTSNLLMTIERQGKAHAAAAVLCSQQFRKLFFLESGRTFRNVVRRSQECNE
jgi:hypothetical protein